MNLAIMAVSIVRCAPVETETSTELGYLPATEATPQITRYEYIPTDTGYEYT